jgi:DNA-binding response OmpR family regulator
MRILVLDDNVDVAQGVGEILELSGYEVVLVHDGLSAVAAYRNGGIDFGLFDIRMPGMNGVEAYLEIRRTHPDAKIVMMSGYADDTLVNTALDNGAIGLLSKPFDPEVMLAHVNNVQSSMIVMA